MSNALIGLLIAPTANYPKTIGGKLWTTLLIFLLRAKRETYAAGGELSVPSRPNSKDLRYAEGPYVYIDTYLGDIDFIGEEAVWKDGQALWGMNYYGWMKVDEIPDGFSKCLKGALLAVPREAPFRGPEEFRSGVFTFRCQWEGDVDALHRPGGDPAWGCVDL